jgi:hypothetical protein
MRFRRPSPATAISCLALFVALGGTSYAAITVTSKNVKNNSLTSDDVKDRSLLSKDFKAGQLPAGARGATGSAGPTGLAGPAGKDGAPGIAGKDGVPGATSVVVRSGEDQVEGGDSNGAVATCAAGERATGGGAFLHDAVVAGDAIVRSYPTTGGTGAAAAGEIPTAWFARVYNASGTEKTMTTFVVCAKP